MTPSFRGGLHPIYLRRPSIVARAVAVACPVCQERPGHPCRVEEGKPVVHDARESVAYHGRKIWV